MITTTRTSTNLFIPLLFSLSPKWKSLPKMLVKVFVINNSFATAVRQRHWATATKNDLQNKKLRAIHVHCRHFPPLMKKSRTRVSMVFILVDIPTLLQSLCRRLWTESINAWAAMVRANQNAPFNYFITHFLASPTNQSTPFPRHAPLAEMEWWGFILTAHGCPYTTNVCMNVHKRMYNNVMHKRMYKRVIKKILPYTSQYADAINLAILHCTNDWKNVLRQREQRIIQRKEGI